MIIKARVAPPNSLLLVMGQEKSEIPESMEHSLVNATTTCVAIGTLSDIDGETDVVLTDEKMYPHSVSDLSLVFSGIIAASRGQVDIRTVNLLKVISLGVTSNPCAVEVWANDRKEPNKVCVVVG